MWENPGCFDFFDSKCTSLICQLCCSHSFEIHARCCLSTPCSFIAFHCFQCLVSVRMVQQNYQAELCCEEWDAPRFCFSVVIKMLYDARSGWLFCTNAVQKDSHLIFPSVISHRYPTSFLIVFRHAIGLNLSRCCAQVSFITLSLFPVLQIFALFSPRW